MKTLLSVLTSVAFTLSAVAIPQNFNGTGNGFFGAVGQQFEDFASQPPALGAGADMKGRWAVVRGQKEVFKLELDAVVFGIPAAEIQAQKSGDVVLNYRVQYSASEDKKRRKQTTKLETRVLAAISAYTGASVELKKPVDHKGVKILVSMAGNGDVFVTFSRAA